MRGLKFAVAVGITSLVLVGVVAVGGLLFAGSALANPAWVSGLAFGPHGFAGQGFNLPPELQGLRDLPAGQQFAHFMGVQVSLKDKDGKPLTLNIIPGTVTASSAGSLTIAANDGTSKTFTLNDSTVVRGAPGQGAGQGTQPALASGDTLIVVTMNDESTARAVIDGGKNGFGQGGPWGHGGWGPR